MLSRALLHRANAFRASAPAFANISVDTSNFLVQDPRDRDFQVRFLSTNSKKDELPKGAINKAKYLWNKYGLMAVGLYVGSYFALVGGAFVVFKVQDNFGLDVKEFLEKIHVKDSLYSFLNLSPDADLSPTTVSAMLALAVGDLLEWPRIALIVYTLPKLHSMIHGPDKKE